ncbi:hypothetical protein Lal_00004676, partial [Lupinus albus]
MSSGWRRAFCTRDPESSLSDNKEQPISPNPRSCGRLNFFSSGSNPSTPRLHQSQSPSLRCRTISEAAQAPIKNESPRIQNKTLSTSNPSSPRTPLKLSLFKNSFKFRSSCGICLNSVKTGQGTAIYTAECSHAFHFPCISAHVRNHGSLLCPVCNATWKDVPLLVAHKNEKNDVVAIDRRKTETSSSKWEWGQGGSKVQKWGLIEWAVDLMTGNLPRLEVGLGLDDVVPVEKS